MSTYGLFTGKGNGKMYIKNMISNKRSYAARTVALVLFMFCIAFGMAHFNPVMADAKTAVKTTEQKKKKTSAKKGHWKTKHLYYFYIQNGKRVRGFKGIAGKYYYFSSQGIQLTGWRKINGKYRYFQIKNGKSGYMVKNKTVNGIHIDKKGVAAVNSETERKLRILTQFQSLADTLVRPGMAKHDKLVTVFKYARDKNYRSIGSPSPTGHWDEMLAEAFLNADWADCTMAANGFAYLANAVGYTNVSVRLYGHGHCEIDRLIYDPGFAKTVADDEYTKYFAKTYAELEAWYTSDDTPTRFI